MNKRGFTLAFKQLMWIPRIVFVIIVIMGDTGLVLGYIVTTIDVSAIESHILINRLQYSPNGIVHYDSETKRVYPGVIDSRRFNSYILDYSLDAEQRFVGRFLKTELVSGNEKLIYFDENTYNNWRPLAALYLERTIKKQAITGLGAKIPHRDIRYISYDGKPAKIETVLII